MGTTPTAESALAIAGQLTADYEAKFAEVRTKLAEQYEAIATTAAQTAETVRTSEFWLSQGHTVHNLAQDVTDLGDALAEAQAIAGFLDDLDRLTGKKA
jgi:hypothetical protein